MAISSRVLGYLESGRNLAGCVGGAVGLVLHFTGVAGSWWPGVVAGLYGVGALLVPGPGAGGAGGAGLPVAGAPVSAEPVGAEPVTGAPVAARPVGGEPAGGELRAGLEELTRYLEGLALPGAAGVAELLERVAGLACRAPEAAGEQGRQGEECGEALRVAGRVVREELPLAVAGYLRARTWQRWAPGGEDPSVLLGREVARMAGALD
ncbi:hypothetical protein [Kitasatospora sp. NPDC050543]|uniref:hypothetical protein n=1 Tax=Kitasatospora sp. NPDC050543 TaxID=3364054 RepID=UPI00379D6C98